MIELAVVVAVVAALLLVAAGLAVESRISRRRVERQEREIAEWWAQVRRDWRKP